jgi:ArsR family transcriptional regulator
MNIKIQTTHEVFRALADPVRLRIAVMLTRGERCVCDIQRALSLPQSTVSRHLGQMRLVGLVEDRRAGKWVYYRLADVGREMRAVLEGLVEAEPHTGDLRQLDEYLVEKGC